MENDKFEFEFDPEEFAKQANMFAIQKIFNGILPKGEDSSLVIEMLSIFVTHGVDLSTSLEILKDICQILKGGEES